MSKLKTITALLAAASLSFGAGGLALTKRWEGLEHKAYPDIVGIWTICYGSTGPHVRPGMTMTTAECNALLREDLVRFEAAVKRCSSPARLNQNQYDALVSFTFNVGERAYCSSTLSRKVRASDFEGAAKEFPKWSYAKGKWIKGLHNRRMDEKALFERPVR